MLKTNFEFSRHKSSVGANLPKDYHFLSNPVLPADYKKPIRKFWYSEFDTELMSFKDHKLLDTFCDHQLWFSCSALEKPLYTNIQNASFLNSIEAFKYYIFLLDEISIYQGEDPTQVLNKLKKAAKISTEKRTELPFQDFKDQFDKTIPLARADYLESLANNTTLPKEYSFNLNKETQLYSLEKHF